MYDYGKRWYDPSIGRFIGVDPIAEKYASVTTFNYAENEPVANIDLWGLQKVNMTWNDPNLQNATKEEISKFRYESTKDAVAVVESIALDITGTVAFDVFASTMIGGKLLKGISEVTENIGKRVKNIIKGGEETIDATKNRVTLRKSTLNKIKENAPKTSSGDYIDPNTGKIIPKEGPYDIGHKTGKEWRTRKKMHIEKGSTRKEVIEAENDPDLYQIEDRSSNRSHKYEKKER